MTRFPVFCIGGGRDAGIFSLHRPL
jgi:hypothetical protein